MGEVNAQAMPTVANWPYPCPLVLTKLDRGAIDNPIALLEIKYKGRCLQERREESNVLYITEF